MGFAYILRCYSVTHLHLVDNIKVWAPWCVFGTMFVLNVVILWPGQMSLDSVQQYEMALTHHYSDHHPPMMSLFWGLLDEIYKGPGLMLLFHLVLLYGAAALLLNLFAQYRIRWLYVGLPLMPPISFYSSMIWKDIGFGVAYLFVSSLMSVYMLRRRPMPVWAIVSSMLLLFYGTAVKFQAQYALPIVLVGLAYCLVSYRVSCKMIVLTLFMYVLYVVGLQQFNNFFVPEEKKSYSWQWVKLYDLAGISIQTGQILFPEFVRNYQYFSTPKIQQGFSYEGVHLLKQYKECPMRIGNNEQEREVLWNYWYATIQQYPLYYMTHRWRNWLNTVNIIPLRKLNTLDFSVYPGLRWFCTLQQQAQRSLSSVIDRYDKVVIAVSKLFFAFFCAIRYAIKPSLLLPFIIIYLMLGCITLSYSSAAMPLLILNGISCAILITFFFLSMASTIRYIFIVLCMTHASHGFAYLCLRDWRARCAWGKKQPL